MKICPKCGSNDVPDEARQCPFCLHYFEKIPSKVEPEKKTVSNPAIGSSDKQKKGGAAEKKSKEEKPASISRTGTVPSKTADGQEVPKKKSGIGKLIGLVIVIIIVVMIIKSCGSSSAPSYDYNAATAPAAEEEPSPTPEIIEEEEEVSEADEYILPYSNSEYLTEKDLEGLSKEELRIARNEIYARHGRRFNDSELQSYFDSKDWYEGTISPEDFTEAHTASVFNQYELANKDFIAQYESTH